MQTATRTAVPSARSMILVFSQTTPASLTMNTTEETGAIVWRHIAFHIIRSPVSGRPNILIVKITLLHTKGEDRTPGV